MLGRDAFVEGDLDRGDVRAPPELVDSCRLDGPARVMGAEQDDAVALTPPAVVEAPDSFGIKPDDGGQPARSVEVEPLLRHPEMAFQHAPADGLDIDDAGEALEIAAQPVPQIRLQRRIG